MNRCVGPPSSSQHLYGFNSEHGLNSLLLHLSMWVQKSNAKICKVAYIYLTIALHHNYVKSEWSNNKNKISFKFRKHFDNFFTPIYGRSHLSYEDYILLLLFNCTVCKQCVQKCRLNIIKVKKKENKGNQKKFAH